MRIFCRVEYDGTNYCGWQVQREGDTVQAQLERAFSIVVRTGCRVTGAGRTDTGVHARAQGMHVDVPDGIDLRRCLVSVNSLLPRDIAIYNLQQVPEAFNARYSAVSRRYTYHIIGRKMPLMQKRAFILSYAIDWNLINQALPVLMGRHDFSTFCAAGFEKENKFCTIKRADIDTIDTMKVFTIEADRFIYKMVRSITGTLLEIGAGKITDSMESILESKDRRRAGQTALACGLYLDTVTYNEVE